MEIKKTLEKGASHSPHAGCILDWQSELPGLREFTWDKSLKVD